MKINIDTAIKNLAINLKRLRKDKEISQAKISFKLDIEICNYQKLEYGMSKHFRFSTLIKILNYYNTTLQKLIKQVDLKKKGDHTD